MAEGGGIEGLAVPGKGDLFDARLVRAELLGEEVPRFSKH